MELLKEILVNTGWCYLIVINAITFLMYGIDKRKARKNQWRIPEKTLIFLAVLGGSPGALIGMYTFHHKTKKLKFQIGIPFILVVQAVAFVLALR